jgi:hypothetical protein
VSSWFKSLWIKEDISACHQDLTVGAISGHWTNSELQQDELMKKTPVDDDQCIRSLVRFLKNDSRFFMPKASIVLTVGRVEMGVLSSPYKTVAGQRLFRMMLLTSKSTEEMICF